MIIVVYLYFQILYTLYELVEGFGTSIKSGWRSLFGALSNTQIYHRHAIEDFNDGEQRRKLVFNIVENFVNIKSTNVFAYVFFLPIFLMTFI